MLEKFRASELNCFHWTWRRKSRKTTATEISACNRNSQCENYLRVKTCNISQQWIYLAGTAFFFRSLKKRLAQRERPPIVSFSVVFSCIPSKWNERDRFSSSASALQCYIGLSAWKFSQLFCYTAQFFISCNEILYSAIRLDDVDFRWICGVEILHHRWRAQRSKWSSIEFTSAHNELLHWCRSLSTVS